MGFLNNIFTQAKQIKDNLSQKIEFDHFYEFEGKDTTQIAINLVNGSVSITESTEDKIRIACHVKVVSTNDNVEISKANFINKFRVDQYSEKLSIIGTAKLMAVDVHIQLPKKNYSFGNIKVVTGSINVEGIEITQLFLESLNGAITVNRTLNTELKMHSVNGHIKGENLESKEIAVQTKNGSVQIDGTVKTIDAKALNGNLDLITDSVEAEKIVATTVAGNIRLGLPRFMSLKGKINTNFGRLDADLEDALVREDFNQTVLKMISIEKKIENVHNLIFLGETRTGSVTVRYSDCLQKNNIKEIR